MRSNTLLSALLGAATASAFSGGGYGSGRSKIWPVKSITNASTTSDWDYIIVGGGPSGIIVAERLVEQNKKVLLLERGGPSFASTGGNATTSWDSDGLTPYDVPSQSGRIFSGGFGETCPDVPGTAGCLLGGGVSINALVFVRKFDLEPVATQVITFDRSETGPPKHDFNDKWPKGWRWADVESSANALYSRNPGTINPSMDGKWYDTAEYDILSEFLVSSSNFTNVNPLLDPDVKTKMFTRPVWNILNGQRAGPVVTYLPLAQASSKFTLQLYTTVIRVVRDGSKITGVEVKDTNTGVKSIINICSGGRVVLASGSMTTPRLLINSGIGQTASIETVQNSTADIVLPARKDWINLPVGAEIKDHPIVNVFFNTTANLTLYPFLNPPIADQEMYLQNRSGPISQNTQRLLFWDSFNGTDGIVRNVQGTTSVSATNALQVRFYLTHGLQSVGSLDVTSEQTTVLSKTPYFSNSADYDGLSNYIANFIALARASGSITPANATATAQDYIRNNFAQGTHFVGTAPIGTDDGRKGGKAVVDLNTKVYGTDNLFVVDASIHADVPTGNTMAIVMVVAEAAAKRLIALK